MVSKSVLTLFTLGLILSANAMAEGRARKPANFVPDDDVIVVPLYVEEKTFIDKVQEEKAQEFKETRRIVNTWILNEEYARNYGMEGRGIVPESTPEERQKFLNRNYLRFFTKRVENDAKSDLQDWWEDVSASDEIDAIDNQEKRSEYLVKANRSKTVEKLTKTETVKVGKEKFKFGFQPRVEMGSVKITAEGFGFQARAWIGVNGDQEVYLEKVFAPTRTRALANYYIDEKKMLAAIDQPITNNLSLRLTHQKDYDPDPVAVGEEEIAAENNTLQFRFFMGF